MTTNMSPPHKGLKEENKNKIRAEVLSANGDEKFRCFAVITILFIFILCLGIALYHGQIRIRMSQHAFDNEILETTMNAINETQRILKLIRDKTPTIAEENKKFYEDVTPGIPKFNLPIQNNTTISSNNSTAIDYQMHAITLKVLKETHSILHRIRIQTAAISEANKHSAESYIAGIRDVIKERTAYGVRRISQIILEQIQDIENELTVFDRDITTMVDGNLSLTKKEIEKIIEEVKKSDASTDMVDLLEDVIKNLEKEISNMVSDFDKMFTFYKSHINDILYQKVEKAADRIRMYIVSERKFSKCIDWERVSFCYNITRQNTEVSNQLESVVEVINVLTNTTNTINTFTSLFPENMQHQHPLLAECKSLLTEALKFSREMLDTMLKDDGYFLGSVIKELSYKEHFHTKKYVLRSYETAMKEFIPEISKATTGFQLVQDKFLAHANGVMFPIIDNLSSEINAKVLLVNETDIRDQLLDKCKFEYIKTMIEEKFKNIASTVNPAFDEQLDIMVHGVDMTVQRDSDEMLPYVSVISIKNYLTTDICPLSVNYQIFITSKVRDGMTWKNELDDPQKIDGNFENYQQITDKVFVNDEKIKMIPESISTKNGSTTAEHKVSTKPAGSFMHLIQSMKDDTAKAGYKADGLEKQVQNQKSD